MDSFYRIEHSKEDHGVELYCDSEGEVYKLEDTDEDGTDEEMEEQGNGSEPISPPASIFCLAVYPSHLLAIGGEDDTFRVYDISSICENISIFPGDSISTLPIVYSYMHSDSIVDLSFSNDYSMVAAASYDGTISTHKIDGRNISIYGECLKTDSDIHFIKWHPKGYGLLAGCDDGSAWMWWVPTTSVMNVLTGHRSAVICGEFSADGNLVCTGSSDGTLIVFEGKSGLAKYTFKSGAHNFHNSKINCVAIRKIQQNGPGLLCSGSEEGLVCVLNLSDGSLINKLFFADAAVTALMFTTHGYTEAYGLCIGYDNGQIRVYDDRSKSDLCLNINEEDEFKSNTVDKEHDKATSCGISKMIAIDEFRFLSSSSDGIVTFWHMHMSKPMFRIELHSDTIWDIQIAPFSNGYTLFTCSDDGVCKVTSVLNSDIT